METWIALFLASLLLSGIPGAGHPLLPPILRAEDTETEPEEKPEDEPEEEEDEDPKPAARTSEQELRVLELFNASTKGFRDGRIVLTYEFEKRQDHLVEDWKPTLEEGRPRIRWSGPTEGRLMVNQKTGLRRREGGVIVADYGQWIHKAAFLSDLEVKVSFINMAHPRAGTIFGPIFHSEKKNLSIGVNGGFQMVCLKGWKPAKPPQPKSDKVLRQRERQTIGLKYSKKTLEAYLEGRKTADSSSSPRFTDGFDTGHAGLAWNGSVQCFITSVTIEGRLDPDWVAGELKAKEGEKK